MIIITVAHGPDKGKVFHLTGSGPHAVGRKHADILLQDPMVSREHGRLFRRDGLWVFEDLGSRTGTLVDDHRAREPQPVNDGTRLRLGQSMLIVNFVPEAHAPLKADPAPSPVPAKAQEDAAPTDQPARPGYGKAAAMLGVGLLFAGLLCGVVVMVARIARQTSEFMN